MIIPIDEKYRLKSDSRQWMVQKLEWVTDKKTLEEGDEVQFLSKVTKNWENFEKNIEIMPEIYEYRPWNEVDIKEKRQDFVSFKYYADINQAVNGLAQLMVRTSEAQTIASALVDVKNVCVTLTDALSPHFNVEVES